MEEAVAHDLFLVLFGLVVELHRRGAQPLLDAGRRSRVDAQDEWRRADHGVEHFEIAEYLETGIRTAPERHETPVETRTVKRQDVAQLELVRDGRVDHLEVAHDLVQPPKGAPKAAIDVVQRLLDRLACRSVLRAQFLRPLAQLVKKRRVAGFAHFAKIPRPASGDAVPWPRAPSRCQASPPDERITVLKRADCRYNPALPHPPILPLPSMALLEIQDVTRRFGDFTAVDRVSLAIEAGEFFTLLGPSGCGKTTLLRMIAGFDLPDGGRILLNGEDLADRPPEARPVRTVFQSYALFPHMTVEGNVAFPLKMAKTPPAEIGRQGRGGAGGRAADRLRQALSARALGRPEAARGDRARAGHASDRAAAGRAARRAGRQAARGNADRAHQPAEGSRHHVRLRHARPDGGAGAVAPHRGHEQGPCRAARRAVAHLQLSRRRASSPTSSAPAICSSVPYRPMRAA